MKKENKSKLIMGIMIAVLAVFIVCQWLPYYSNGNGEMISLASYFAFPLNHPDVTDVIAAQIPGYTINQILSTGLVIPIVAVILLILVIAFKANPIVIGACGLLGLWGIIGYAGNEALRLGNGTHTLYIVLSCMILAAAVVYFVDMLVNRKKEGEKSEEVVLEHT